jgi:cytochrome c peroxidase
MTPSPALLRPIDLPLIRRLRAAGAHALSGWRWSRQPTAPHRPAGGRDGHRPPDAALPREGRPPVSRKLRPGVVVALAGACITTLATDVATADEDLRQTAHRLFGRVEAAPPAERDAPAARLGRALFWDERLSADGRTSCASCHTARDGGADPRNRPVDARGRTMPRNSQTVFNALAQPTLRWLADRPDAARMAEGLATGPLGFAKTDEVLAALERAGYGDRFRAAFAQDAEPLSMRNYGRAVAAYQATLATPAPFDRYLAGDDSALDARQRAGLRHFIGAGCAGCHSGPLLGGSLLQRFGIARDYASATGSNPVDPGRIAITGKEEDRHVFRVPMLRNIAKTAPYFHDGAVADLTQAVRVMADVQLGRQLDPTQLAEIVAFLESLTGEVPAHYAPPPAAGH